MRDAVWTRFEEQAWQTERQLKAEQRAAKRAAADQIHRSIRDDLQDVNTSLLDLRAMLSDEFGTPQGLARQPGGRRREKQQQKRAADKYKILNEKEAMKITQTPFLPTTKHPSKSNSRHTAAATLYKAKGQHGGHDTMYLPGQKKASTDSKLGRKTGRGSPGESPMKLHALTGSPQKRGGGGRGHGLEPL